jgi:hypothetical protein
VLHNTSEESSVARLILAWGSWLTSILLVGLAGLSNHDGNMRAPMGTLGLLAILISSATAGSLRGRALMVSAAPSSPPREISPDL